MKERVVMQQHGGCTQKTVVVVLFEKQHRKTFCEQDQHFLGILPCSVSLNRAIMKSFHGKSNCLRVVLFVFLPLRNCWDFSYRLLKAEAKSHVCTFWGLNLKENSWNIDCLRIVGSHLAENRITYAMADFISRKHSRRYS